MPQGLSDLILRFYHPLVCVLKREEVYHFIQRHINCLDTSNSKIQAVFDIFSTKSFALGGLLMLVEIIGEELGSKQ